MAKKKITKKEKKRWERTLKKLTTRYCIKVTELGFCECPHCKRLLLCGFGSLPKAGLHVCEGCSRKFVIDEDIATIVRQRCERLETLLNKIRPYGGAELAEIEKAIDNNCDIEELALLCKYYGCDITKLAHNIKRLSLSLAQKQEVV
jgi:hypothetical protein